MDPPEPIPGARLLFSLDPAVAHLNHGSFGAVPIGVQRAQQRLRDEMEANPMRFFALGLQDRVEHVRRHVAAFLGADPDGSALVDNVTTGVTQALASLDLRPGDELVTTDHGYGTVQRAVAVTCQRTGAVNPVVELPLTPDDDTVVAAVRKACSARTKLIAIDEISSPTAWRLPVARIVEVAQEVGAAVLVDAAHAPGQLVEPARGAADFWVGNLHKWALAPRGTALLSVAPRWRDRMRPPVVSWQDELGFPASFEWLGSRDYTSWLAAPTALFTLRTLGLDRVLDHNARLARYAQRVVGAAVGAPDQPDTGLAMRMVPLPPGRATDLDSATALRRRIADELATEVAVTAWNGRGLLRLSAHVYNRPEEFDRLAAGLPRLL